LSGSVRVSNGIQLFLFDGGSKQRRQSAPAR
jgi:hypothetical protein